MKKKFVAILAMGLALSTCLAACGGNSNSTQKNSQNSQAGADATDLKGTYDITV